MPERRKSQTEVEVILASRQLMQYAITDGWKLEFQRVTDLPYPTKVTRAMLTTYVKMGCKKARLRRIPEDRLLHSMHLVNGIPRVVELGEADKWELSEEAKNLAYYVGIMFGIAILKANPTARWLGVEEDSRCDSFCSPILWCKKRCVFPTRPFGENIVSDTLTGGNPNKTIRFIWATWVRGADDLTSEPGLELPWNENPVYPAEQA